MAECDQKRPSTNNNAARLDVGPSRAALVGKVEARPSSTSCNKAQWSGFSRNHPLIDEPFRDHRIPDHCQDIKLRVGLVVGDSQRRH